MRFSVFYLNNPILGISLNADTHTLVSRWLHADDVATAFTRLEQENIPNSVAIGIADKGLRRFSPVPGDILVSETGDIIRKTHQGFETLGATVHTLRLCHEADAVGTPGWKRLLERCSFTTLKDAYVELADTDRFPPEEHLPF